MKLFIRFQFLFDLGQFFQIQSHIFSILHHKSVNPRYLGGYKSMVVLVYACQEIMLADCSEKYVATTALTLCYLYLLTVTLCLFHV